MLLQKYIYFNFFLFNLNLNLHMKKNVFLHSETPEKINLTKSIPKPSCIQKKK